MDDKRKKTLFEMLDRLLKGESPDIFADETYNRVDDRIQPEQLREVLYLTRDKAVTEKSVWNKDGVLQIIEYMLAFAEHCSAIGFLQGTLKNIEDFVLEDTPAEITKKCRAEWVDDCHNQAIEWMHFGKKSKL